MSRKTFRSKLDLIIIIEIYNENKSKNFISFNLQIFIRRFKKFPFSHFTILSVSSFALFRRIKFTIRERTSERIIAFYLKRNKFLKKEFSLAVKMIIIRLDFFSLVERNCTIPWHSCIAAHPVYETRSTRCSSFLFDA